MKLKPQNKNEKPSSVKSVKKLELKTSPKSKKIAGKNVSPKKEMSPKNIKKIIKEKNAEETNGNKAGSIKKKGAKINKKPKNKNKNGKVPAQSGVPIMKSIIPKAYPTEMLIQVSKVPKNVKQIEIIETFNKYGSITYIQNITKDVVVVAFSKEEEAQAAISANNEETLRGKKLQIKQREKKFKATPEDELQLFDRTVLVFRVNASTTEEDIRNHFSNCGEIESIKSVKRLPSNHFVILFADQAACQAASKLHNSILKESTINVRLKSIQPTPWDMKRTIILLNPDGLTKLDGAKVAKVFSACGDIEKCDVLCDKQKLAIITFKNEEAIQKVLKLNTTTQNGLNIQIKLYSDEIQKNAMPVKLNPYIEKLKILKETKRKIYVKKLPKEVTEEDISEFFTRCGPVKSVTLLPERGAVVEFTDSDGFCEAFTYNEYPFKGQELYILPYSETKRPTFEPEKLKKAIKRPASSKNGSPVKAKRVK